MPLLLLLLTDITTTTHIHTLIVIQVILVDEKSRSIVKENDKCNFHISSYESTSGTLKNPKHSLPPNTTCSYHLQGKPNEIVWLSFVKYYASTTDIVTSHDVTSECNAKLLIWDGDRVANRLGSQKVYYTYTLYI